MIQEEYVSFETAKLLKEKGFDEPCYSYYTKDTHKFIQSWSMHAIMNKTNPCFFGYAAPTQAMAMRWLREVLRLYINVEVISLQRFSFSVLVETSEKFYFDDPCERGKRFYSYEEACEAAIKYCLENLIQQQRDWLITSP